MLLKVLVKGGGGPLLWKFGKHFYYNLPLRDSQYTSMLKVLRSPTAKKKKKN